MVLKTFNVEEATYSKFSKVCKDMGISMSRQVERFMQSFIEEEPVAKKSYLKKLDKIRQQKDIHIGTISDFRARYGLK